MRIRLIVLLLALSFCASAYAQPKYIPSPQDVLGFTPGDDRKLASWNQVLTYFDKLDQASDRVKFQALGKSTMDVPFVMATISAPENLAKLDQYIDIQQKLADPRKLGAPSVRDRRASALIAEGKTIVLITCGIHSTEVGSYLSSMLMAYRLASSNDPEILNILKNTIVLLVPSLNPDGVDIVKNWYDKTLGTPYEGTSPPELYHKYVGHDNNRDWYAFTQVETQITVDKIHNVWRPHIVHDIHQQGEFASRIFLPPYMPPVEPNVPHQIVAGFTELGNWIAGEMRREGFKGITTGSTYDAWTPARAYSHYHGGVRILSETASAKIASPISVRLDQLRSREGYDPLKESPTFGPVWRGGEWKLRDITNYMTGAAFKLMTHAANNRERWLTRFYEIGKEAVRPRRNGELFGYQIEAGVNTLPLLQILERADVEIYWLQGERPVQVARDTRHGEPQGSVTFPGRTAIIPMAQPYGAFAKTLLETQRYPNLRDASGHPVSPYDVTAYTLPLLMNVAVTPIRAPFNKRFLSHARMSIGIPDCQIVGEKRLALYKSSRPNMDEGWTRWVLGRCSNFESISDFEIRRGDFNQKYRNPLPQPDLRYRTIIFPDQSARDLLNGYARGAMPAEYVGGIGQDGVKSLRDFVESGGTLVFLNRSSQFAIEQFKLPVRNVVQGVSEKQFFAPGSIVRIELDTTHPIAMHMPKQSVAWLEESPVFEINRDSSASERVKIIARYPAHQNPLLSGWLLGVERLQGKAALVEVELGQGRIILFGFRPQYRGQSLATFPLFFNSLKS